MADELKEQNAALVNQVERLTAALRELREIDRYEWLGNQVSLLLESVEDLIADV